MTRQPEIQPCATLALRTPAITDTPIIRTAAKSPAKTKYRCLTDINSLYSQRPLLPTLQGPRVSVLISESETESQSNVICYCRDLHVHVAAVRIIWVCARRELVVHCIVSIYFLRNLFFVLYLSLTTVFRQLKSSDIYFICGQLRQGSIT